MERLHETTRVALVWPVAAGLHLGRGARIVVAGKRVS
jgi:hypothetical protein